MSLDIHISQDACTQPSSVPFVPSINLVPKQMCQYITLETNFWIILVHNSCGIFLITLERAKIQVEGLPGGFNSQWKRFILLSSRS
jgi:hypothetical protein